ncbi:MAG: hypothetical protein NTX45_07975 [Proteobacteria bacterium]|nr:hypothetical protein [Pseudomonadota bacterium]
MINNCSYYLRVNDRLLTNQSAELTLSIETENWNEGEKAWIYGVNYLYAQWILDIVVNDQSCEDGDPSPSLVFYIQDSESIHSLQDLPRTRFEDPDDILSEAWYGNDAPRLYDNSLSFGEWQDFNHLILNWSAILDGWDESTERAEFLFVGLVKFNGIKMKVKHDNDAVIFLQNIFPSLNIEELELVWGDWIDYGDDWPTDRRKWHSVSWHIAPSKFHSI